LNSNVLLTDPQQLAADFILESVSPFAKYCINDCKRLKDSANTFNDILIKFAIALSFRN
jgi:hypothetical protein